jgi:hypothetical protein
VGGGGRAERGGEGAGAERGGGGDAAAGPGARVVPRQRRHQVLHRPGDRGVREPRRALLPPRPFVAAVVRPPRVHHDRTWRLTPPASERETLRDGEVRRSLSRTKPRESASPARDTVGWSGVALCLARNRERARERERLQRETLWDGARVIEKRAKDRRADIVLSGPLVSVVEDKDCLAACLRKRSEIARQGRTSNLRLPLLAMLWVWGCRAGSTTGRPTSSVHS